VASDRGVYLRHSTFRKDGKTHVYWRLVRSVRVGAWVRQEIVATLGELDGQGRAKARLPSGRARLMGRPVQPAPAGY